MTEFLRRLTGFALLALGLLTVSAWLVRFGNDLSWDEALNLRSYSKHPLTALALYREPNNHVLESVYKSLFHWGLGLDKPPFWRLPGLVLVAVWLAVVWRWRRLLIDSGSVVAATMLTILAFTANGPFTQAMVMRGYFLSIVLALVYGLVLARRAGLIEPSTTSASPPASPPRPYGGRDRLLFGFLAALILWAVPSNILLIPGLIPATVLAFERNGRTTAGGAVWVLRETLLLGLITGLWATLLYAPVFASLLLGICSLHLIPTEGGVTAVGTMWIDLLVVLEQATPFGVHPAASGGALVAIMLGGLAVARRSPALVAAAWPAIGAAFVLPVALAGIVEYPARTKSPAAGPILVGVIFLVHAMTCRWSASRQHRLAALLATLALGLAPMMVRAEKVDHEATDFVAALAVLTRPDQRRVVVGHDDLVQLHFPMAATFGDDAVLDGRVDMQLAFDGQTRAADHAAGSWQKRLRDRLFDRRERRRLAPEEIDVLVLVNHVGRPPKVSPLLWRHWAVSRLKEIRPSCTRRQLGAFEVEIWE